MFTRLAMLLLLVAGCGPRASMPQSSVNPPVRQPPGPISAADGEIMGADKVAPADRLAEGPQVVARPGDEPPARVEPAPGWYLDRNRVGYSVEQQQRMVGSTLVESNESEVRMPPKSRKRPPP
jgi:hypothetical protein